MGSSCDDGNKRSLPETAFDEEVPLLNADKEQGALDLVLANKELLFQNEEKERRAAELIIANKELAFQNEEKEKRAAELIIANKELAFQNEEKEKRAAELVIANKELLFQNDEKEKRTAELIIANKELAFQNGQKAKQEAELVATISQLERSEDLLKTANEELDAFSYSVSHDLRAPLRAIGGFAQMLKEDYATTLDSNGTRLLGIIQQSAVKMGILIDDLLTLSRLGKKEMLLSSVNMTDLTNRVLGELSELTHHNAEIVVHPLPVVLADASLLSYALTNLLGNAIKYSSKKEHPRIEITARRENDLQVFSISDNGAGFDMRYQNKLFQVFQRLHKEKDFEGTGIGLAITKRIINKHNGSVWATGELGKGATFQFSIPDPEPLATYNPSQQTKTKNNE